MLNALITPRKLRRSHGDVVAPRSETQTGSSERGAALSRSVHGRTDLTSQRRRALHSHTSRQLIYPILLSEARDSASPRERAETSGWDR